MPAMITAGDVTAMNVGRTERIGSAIAGAVLIGRAIAHPSIPRILMAIGGAALLQRGLTGHCQLYNSLGIDTAGNEHPALRADGEDVVEAASDDSFPASDPPSWTPVAGTAAKHQPATG